MSGDVFNQVAWAGFQRLRPSPADLVNAVLPAGHLAVLPSPLMSPHVFNVLDFGAVGDGVTDDTEALVAAMSAVPAAIGGAVLLPVGYAFVFSNHLPLKSNTTVLGGGTLKAAPFASWAVTGVYWGLTNVNNGATVITDTDITIRDITVDYTDFPSAGGPGTRFCIYFRMARRIRCLNVRTIGGTDSFAYLGCDQVLTENPHCVGFTNCGVDHWEGPTSCAVLGGYLETSATNQMINFNPETGPGPTGQVAQGFSMIGVEMVFTGASTSAVLIEPLYAVGSSVSDVVVSECIFTKTRLAIRGRTDNVSVMGNVFNTPGGGEVIFSYTHKGGSPSNIVISGNTIKNAETTAPNGGVIRLETDTGIVIGNIIKGTAYTGAAVYTSTFRPNVLSNRTALTPPAPFLQGGIRVLNGSANYIGIEDNGGNTGLRAYVQTDNTLVVQTTDSGGVARSVMSLVTRNASSQVNWAIGTLFSDVLRIVPATGLTAAGATSGTALNLAKNFNEITTVAAGTGVRLPATGAQSVTGLRVVVWNAGANTLKVYPMTGGQINALGVDVADTIAAGGCKTYVAMSSSLYRIET